MAAITGTTLALAAGAGLATGVVVSKLSKQPKAPQLPDPKAERAKAEAEAAQRTNSRLAARNRARAASSLLAKSSDTAGAYSNALGAAPGKTTLGQ